MAILKDISLGKRAKITKAQQYMVFAVVGASIFLGATIAVITSSLNKISFSASVISAEDESIAAFSDVIKNIGICQKPKGSVYSDEELKKCTPNSVSVSSVPGTLRSNIIENMASNMALSSVPNENNASCINPSTNRNYTHAELEQYYDDAVSSEDDSKISGAVALIKSCSALRVIPDALPSYKNQEALLASVDKIYRETGIEPESLSPSDETDWASFGTNLYTIEARVSHESDAATIYRLLSNLERSIRNFNITRATFTWSSNNSLEFQATANAYYMSTSSLLVSDKTLRLGGK